MAATIRFINPAGLVRSPAYTQVVEVAAPGRTVYISGQLGTAPDGKLAGRDFRTQAEQVFANLATALASVGAGFFDIVKIDSYLADIAHLPILREVRGAPSQSDGAAGQHHDRSLRLRARRRLAGDRGHRGGAGRQAARAQRKRAQAPGGAGARKRQGRATKTKVRSANTGSSTTPDHSMKPKKLGILTPRSTAIA